MPTAKQLEIRAKLNQQLAAIDKLRVQHSELGKKIREADKIIAKTRDELIASYGDAPE